MRCFLAFDLPVPLLRLITGVQSHFRAEYPKLRWVKYENLHLTLHFLGEISREIMDMIVEGCRPIVKQHKAFQVGAGELGAFPHWKAPAVLWLSLTGELGPMKQLHSQTAGIIKKMGLKLDNRPFLPHITLARVPAGCKEGLNRASFDNFSFEEHKQQFSLSVLTLYTSELRPQGPIYRPYCHFELRKEY